MQRVGPPPDTGLAALGISDSSLLSFAEALQDVVASGVRAAVPSPSLSTPTVKVATLSLIHLYFICRLALDGHLPPIWYVVARGKGKMERLSTLNQVLM